MTDIVSRKKLYYKSKYFAVNYQKPSRIQINMFKFTLLLAFILVGTSATHLSREACGKVLD